jgi:hypothetical protein
MPWDEVVADTTELLTTEQVMDILIADAVLRRFAATCVLPGVLIGGAARFRRTDLDAWIRRQRAICVGAS